MTNIEINLLQNAFDTFCTLLESVNIKNEITRQNLAKAFECSKFIESTIRKAQEEGKEAVLKNLIQEKWLQKGKSTLFECSDFETACDKLLEVYLKSSFISTELIDDLLKLYIEHCGRERLNEFLKHTLMESICTNMILQSLQDVGVSFSDMEDECLIMSWEIEIENGHLNEVHKCLRKMIKDGYLSKLVSFLVNLPKNNTIKPLIKEILLSKIDAYDASICLALVNMDKKLLLKLMERDTTFQTAFLDAIFYFGRNMKLIKGMWSSDYEFKYEHLVKILKILLDGPDIIYNVVHDRLHIAMTQSNSAVWSDVEKALKTT